MAVYAVITARNAEQHIRQCLVSLKKQTLPPAEIILVDDGSTDTTAQIATELGATVIHLPWHKNSHAATPKMAKKFNTAFQTLDTKLSDEDYLLIVGADDWFPPSYVASLIDRMRLNPKLVLASGQALGEVTNLGVPRGSGRLIQGYFWHNHMGSRYPENYAWEDTIHHKARIAGFQGQAFMDIIFRRSQTQRTSKKCYGDGRSMYVLGYSWLFMFLRCARLALKSPRRAITMILGWMSAPLAGIKRDNDVVSYVRQYQWKRVKAFVHEIFKRWMPPL